MAAKPSVKTVACPSCGRPVPWEAASRFRPFCSERCKQVDLGAWANEEYRVPAAGGGQDAAEGQGDLHD